MQFEQLVEGPYDCHQSVMANILSYYGYDYSSVALGKICFMYFNTLLHKKIGERIQALHLRKNARRNELLGIKLIKGKFENDMQHIDEYLNAHIPVVIWADLYDCNWNDAYNKYHFEHCYIIYSKKSEDEYIAADPYFGKKEIIQSKSELIKMAVSYWVYLKSTLSDNNDFEIIDEIKRDAQYYQINKMHENILHFCDDLIGVNLLKECNYPNIELFAIPLLDNLKIVGQQRSAYSIMLKSLNTRLKCNWEHIAENLNMSSQYWEKVRIYITKKILTKNKSCDTEILTEYLYQISKLEEISLNELLQ